MVATLAVFLIGIASDTSAEPGPHHTRHFELFGAGVPMLNRAVLRGVDRVQARAMDGGGYFIGIKANPPESPVGYRLSLFGKPLLEPPRGTSYCSGSSYAAFIEAIDEVMAPYAARLSDAQFEALRMQEPDGGRREDGVKAWGWWNADGWGSHYALVQYLGMGQRVPTKEAMPGDFMNISWKNGLGHSVVFLGWTDRGVRYWASQTGTNGYGDQVSGFDKIQSVVTVRLTKPLALLSFDPNARVATKFAGDTDFLSPVAK